jgi:hypothetical protein
MENYEKWKREALHSNSVRLTESKYNHVPCDNCRVDHRPLAEQNADMADRFVSLI